MTFEAYEQSVDAGRPVKLYTLRLGALAWRYTSADRSVAFAGHDYDALPGLEDDGVRQTGDSAADELLVTVPHDLPVVRLFRVVPPATEIEVEVRTYHWSDVDAGFRISFTGSIVGVRRRSPAKATLVCQSDLASLDRLGLTRGWQRPCPYSVYNADCKVNPALFRVVGTVTAIAGSIITAPAWGALADGWFDFGYVEWSIGSGEWDRRGVERHVGNDLTLLWGADGIAIGTEVRAYAGCSGQPDVCDGKFGNILNYGGFKGIPGKSPYDGSQVW